MTRRRETANASLDQLMTPQELAEHVGVPLATVRQWRVKGTGPHGFMVGKHLRYRRADVAAWLDKLANR